MDDASANKRGSISALANGLTILEVLSAARGLRGVTEIAAHTQLHKSTVSRVLSTLEEYQLVEQDGATRKFRLGVGVVALAGPLLARLDLPRAGGDLIVAISEATSESCALVSWTGREGVVVDHVDSPRLVKHITPIGTRIARPRAASMQVFLSELDQSHRSELNTEYSQFPAEFDATYAEIKERGYAINDGDTDPEEWSVASPIRDFRGDCVGAVLISVPRFRVTPGMSEDLPKRAVATAEQISRRLGH
ncbi:IclR family transcriptional regulator [Corynebacterium callunae]|uniref:IclR family transcriptional regulator n=1 Tax=Corynebacterium callunae TaxID=1721 RepID=UPI0039829527